MSGYWSAIAAAARGGAGARGDAVPAPPVPLFAPMTDAEEDEWGAVDIEAAAPMQGPPYKSLPEQVDVPHSPAGEGQGTAPQPPAPTAAAILQPAVPPSVEANSEGSATSSSPIGADLAVAAVAAEPALPIPASVSGPPKSETSIVPVPSVVVPSVDPASPVEKSEAEIDRAGDGDEYAPAIAEAMPAILMVEAVPAAMASGIEAEAFDGVEVQNAADLPSPIHIHIDRIDIRLTEDDRHPARSAPRRAAPVVALDEFLRRPAERKG